MENKIITYVISFILCVILFVSETLLLIQYNINKGIRKEDIIKIIDNINLEEELKELDNYDELKLNEEVLNEIINSNELNTYVKENAKSIYLKIIYGENINYINNTELKEYINNKLILLQEQNEITELDKIEILNIIDEIISKVENNIEKTSSIGDTNIIENIMSNKATIYILIITLLLTLTKRKRILVIEA